MGRGCPWGLGTGHMFDGKLYFTRDICKEDQIPKQVKVPVRSKPAKVPKGLPRRLQRPVQPHRPILSLSLKCPLNMSKSSRSSGLARKSFIQCLCNGQAHRNNTAYGAGTTSMSLLDGCRWCCACSAKVVKWYGIAVHPPLSSGDCHYMTAPPRCKTAPSNRLWLTSTCGRG